MRNRNILGAGGRQLQRLLRQHVHYHHGLVELRLVHAVRRGLRRDSRLHDDLEHCLHGLQCRHVGRGRLDVLHGLRGRHELRGQRNGVELHSLHDVPRRQRADGCVHTNLEHGLCAVPRGPVRRRRRVVLLALRNGLVRSRCGQHRLHALQ